VTRSRVLRNIEGYLWISPWLLGMLFFTLGPLLFSLAMSFTQWDIVTPPIYRGFGNYLDLFRKDLLFGTALLNTAYYAVVSVPLRVGIALTLALLLCQGLSGTKFFRTIYYLPSVTTAVAISMVWVWIFDPNYGVMNGLLELVGIKGPRWLGSPDWAMPSLILVSCMYIGQMMVVFIAGINGIPRQLYEVAELDGAGRFARFRSITLPMLSPSVFFNLVTSIIASFQVFAFAYIMTDGGPMNATMVYVLYLFKQAFLYMHMGYASAMAWVLFLITMVFTLIQLKFSGWVYYESGRAGI
jgi:multiple sugar transport system permease protein